MDDKTADQIGRELAWVMAKQAGWVSDDLVKSAGLLEGLLFAPLTALAALFTAPWGSKLHSMGMGFLLGAGMGAVTNKEVANRQQQGEQVNPQALSPMMKAILAGVAMGGAARAKGDLEKGKSISSMSAMLTGAPLGAMTSNDPATGLAVGGAASQLISVLQATNLGKAIGPASPSPGQVQPAQVNAASPMLQAQPLRL